MRRDRSRALLAGPGWGPWRGGWSGSACLVGCSGWTLWSGDRVDGRWDRLELALEELWSARRCRGRRPWVVGWLSYEACAEHAGGLPVCSAPPGAISGALLVEPDRADLALARNRSPAGAMRVSLDDHAYRAAVATALERIRLGALYQVNVTRRFSVTPWGGGAGRVLECAATHGMPPWAAWVDAAGIEVMCASMELLLRRRDEVVETRPIKGTRPRTGDPQRDVAAARDLARDPKELAELAMVVDLERNDLGRVATVGSVEVVDPGRVCGYGNVLHRVARVRARVSRDVPWWKVLAAMAPGGSVTGCPKYAAMNLIRRLEPADRGPYTGVLGVVSGSGDMELALPIRTAWLVDSRLEFAAGSGIVWGSDPVREEAESRLKVERWLQLADYGA